MARSTNFHPEALLEYAEAVSYYLREASSPVAEEFAVAVESALAGLVAAPSRWRIVEHPEIRRYVFTRFPFVLYYRWESKRDCVVIYAVMHCSREPGYWHRRIQGTGE